MARTAFKVGCYLAFLTAMLHMVGVLTGPPQPTNDTERQLFDLASTYKMPLPGGPSRSMIEINSGFSLTYALMLALTGGLGLIILRRSAADPLLLRASARALAGGYLVLLAISLTYFFLIPTICTAAIAAAFATAAMTRT